jgi:tripartite-type tricarboxylate transporter receptor subunit TctC
MRWSRRLLLSALATGLARPSLAQERFPDRPIRLIVPSAPGGGLDVHLRVLAEIASRKLAQPVVTENRPGATSTLGVIAMRSARPDGYNLTQIPSSAYPNPHWARAPF